MEVFDAWHVAHRKFFPVLFFVLLTLHLVVTSLGCFLQYNGVFSCISAHTLDFNQLACFRACSLNFTCIFLYSLLKNPLQWELIVIFQYGLRSPFVRKKSKWNNFIKLLNSTLGGGRFCLWFSNRKSGILTKWAEYWRGRVSGVWRSVLTWIQVTSVEMKKEPYDRVFSFNNG